MSPLTDLLQKEEKSGSLLRRRERRSSLLLPSYKGQQRPESLSPQGRTLTSPFLNRRRRCFSLTAVNGDERVFIEEGSYTTNRQGKDYWENQSPTTSLSCSRATPSEESSSTPNDDREAKDNQEDEHLLIPLDIFQSSCGAVQVTSVLSRWFSTTMGQKVSRNDFEWAYTDEPHATRRKLILAKHPEIKTLMGIDPWFKWKVLAVVALQMVNIYFLSYIHNPWILFLIAYCYTGVLSHSLMLAVHEISHAQAFGQQHVLRNKLFGFIANLPLGIPMSVSFKKYHLPHHRHQGDETFDTDVPTEFEGRIFRTTFMKLIWVILQPFFYTIRPLVVCPLPTETLEVVNLVIQLSFNTFVGVTCGWHVVAVMVGGSIIAMGLHPVAGHFISEHYILHDKEVTQFDASADEMIGGVRAKDGRPLIPETCSYYGPLNWITFNVGYHVEHHDFPYVPGSRLHKIREMAPEFYNHLNYHTSWTYVLWKYITDPKVGPYSRVKRKAKVSRLPNGDGVISDPNENVKSQ